MTKQRISKQEGHCRKTGDYRTLTPCMSCEYLREIVTGEYAEELKQRYRERRAGKVHLRNSKIRYLGYRKLRDVLKIIRGLSNVSSVLNRKGVGILGKILEFEASRLEKIGGTWIKHHHKKKYIPDPRRGSKDDGLFAYSEEELRRHLRYRESVQRDSWLE